MKDTGVIVFYSSVRRAANENIKKNIVAILCSHTTLQSNSYFYSYK